MTCRGLLFGISRIFKRLAGALRGSNGMWRSAGQDPRAGWRPLWKIKQPSDPSLDRLPPKPIERPEDLHVQSQALHALHFLKVMAETLPKAQSLSGVLRRESDSEQGRC